MSDPAPHKPGDPLNPPPVRLAVVSDTHGHAGNTLDAVRMLEALRPDVVIHCGDIGSEAIVPLFEAWPTHFVFGNVDGDARSLRRAIEHAGQTCHDRFGTLEVAGKRIAFLHGDDLRRLAETIDGGQWDLVCHGHTHLVRNERRGRTLVVNPGALYRAQRHTIALVELPSLAVTIVEV